MNSVFSQFKKTLENQVVNMALNEYHVFWTFCLMKLFKSLTLFSKLKKICRKIALSGYVFVRLLIAYVSISTTMFSGLT